MEREDRAKRPRGAMRCSHKKIFRIIGRAREARARRAEKMICTVAISYSVQDLSTTRKKIRSRRVVRGVRSAFTSTARDVRSSVDRRTHAVARVRTALPRSRTRLRLSARRSRPLVRSIHSRTVLVMSLASRSTPAFAASGFKRACRGARVGARDPVPPHDRPESRARGLADSPRRARHLALPRGPLLFYPPAPSAR